MNARIASLVLKSYTEQNVTELENTIVEILNFDLHRKQGVNPGFEKNLCRLVTKSFHGPGHVTFEGNINHPFCRRNDSSKEDDTTRTNSVPSAYSLRRRNDYHETLRNFVSFCTTYHIIRVTSTTSYDAFTQCSITCVARDDGREETLFWKLV